MILSVAHKAGSSARIILADAEDLGPRPLMNGETPQQPQMPQADPEISQEDCKECSLREQLYSAAMTALKLRIMGLLTYDKLNAYNKARELAPDNEYTRALLKGQSLLASESIAAVNDEDELADWSEGAIFDGEEVAIMNDAIVAGRGEVPTDPKEDDGEFQIQFN